jgi:hypothetical protein
MERKIFNPSDWLEQPNPKSVQTNNPLEAPGSDTEEVEKIIRQIEANQIDIATAYSDWRDIGFAFADAFNESGRDYFHRVSRFYADYSSTECDKQFNNCLKSRGQGVTIKTFFFHAKQAGINIGKPLPAGERFIDGLPTLEKPVLLTTTIRRKRPIDSGGN